MCGLTGGLYRTYIIKYCWLANTTGRRDGFLPIDLLQEHNVRDIKVSSSSYLTMITTYA